MSDLTALGTRPIQTTLPRTVLSNGAAAGPQQASASGKLAAQLPVVEPVSLSSSSVALSQQALNARLAQLGDKTVDVAQKFIGSFTQSLFGDAAKGATFNFDAISVSADTSLSASIQRTSGATGGVDSATLQLNDSASFVGHGQILTNDGQSFEFQVEVRYQASASATSTTSTQAAQAQQEPLSAPDSLTLTGKQLPPVEYPGSLADLFKLLGRQLDISTNSGKNNGNNGNNGNLSLRLIRLVNSAALIAPRVRADNPEATPVERNRALASYAPPAPSSTVAAA